MTRTIRIAAIGAFLFSCMIVTTACVPMIYANVPIKPSLNTPLPESRYPLRVAMLADKELLDYVATGRDSINIPLQYEIKTLPNYYMKVLLDHFDAAEAVYDAASISKDRFDAVAMMKAKKWHFNVPIQTYLSASVDMDMAFDIKTLKGEPLFSTTIVKQYKMPWAAVQDWGPDGFARISSPAIEEVFALLAREIEASAKLKAYKPQE